MKSVRIMVLMTILIILSSSWPFRNDVNQPGSQAGGVSQNMILDDTVGVVGWVGCCGQPKMMDDGGRWGHTHTNKSMYD